MPAEATNGSPAGEPAAGPNPEELAARVEALAEEVERLPDARARALAHELMGAVLDLYGEGLERIVAAIEDAGEPAAGLRERLSADGVVSSLLLIHGLYPVPLADRVEEALQSVRPYMESHGGDVELLSLSGDVARLRLKGSCEGCPASSATLELAIESALQEAAPDLEAIEVEGLEAPEPAGLEVSGMELPVVQAGAADGAEPARGPAWFELDGELDALAEGEILGLAVSGTKLVVAMVGGSRLAYLDSCPDCGSELAGGELSEGVLACPSCERRYHLPRAGRSLDDDMIHLSPVPLLGAEGRTRVALAR